MGKTAADVEREIEELRRETDLAVAELGFRLRDSVDVRSQMRRHPAITAGTGLALLTGIGFAGYSVYTRVQAERKSGTRHIRRAGEVKGAVGRKGSQLARSLPQALPEQGGERDLLKRLLHTAMTAALVAFATFLARRTAETIWSRTMEERPPSQQY